MVKKKRIISKLILALVVLTAVSCCFLGSTFARYTSGGTGSASMDVAKWEISFAGPGSGAAQFDKLSPSNEVFTSSSTPRTNATKPVLVATLENKSEVKAEVTVAVELGEDGNPVYTFKDSKDVDVTFDSGEGITTGADTENATKEQVSALFSIKFYYNPNDYEAATMDSTSGMTEITGADGGKLTLDAAGTAEGNTKVNIFAVLTWTSADAGADNGTVPDAIDTWVGEHVASLSVNLTFTAVQASQIPTA